MTPELEQEAREAGLEPGQVYEVHISEYGERCPWGVSSLLGFLIRWEYCLAIDKRVDPSRLYLATVDAYSARLWPIDRARRSRGRAEAIR